MAVEQKITGFSIIQDDWSLNGRGRKDERRHDEKVKEAIAANLPNIISDGDIITADPDGKKIIKIPMKSLDLPDFRFGDNKEGVASGSGDEQEGDVVGRKPGPGDKSGSAGSGSGVEYYETEFTLQEIQEMVFAELGLPNLLPRPKETIPSEDIIFDDRMRKRTPRHLDMKQTLIANMKRKAQETGKVGPPRDISPEDYRVRTYREREKEQNNAVAIFMMDRSGSMGEKETYIARAMCWWAVSFLRSRYPKVEIVFIVHESEAHEVKNEADFFSRGSSGGTMCSSANVLTLDIINKRYPPSLYNIYPMHLSDGDNWSGDDNALCAKLIQEQLDLGVNQYAYIQIGSVTASSLLNEYRSKLRDSRFAGVIVKDKADVWGALKTIYKPDTTSERR